MTGLLIAIFSGALTALGGIGYKIAGFGKVNVVQNAGVLSLFGVLFFGLRAVMTGELEYGSWELLMLAGGCGIFQYFGVLLLQRGLMMGPLSLVWCASSMQFMPALVFAYFAYGEPLTKFHLTAIVMIIGGIVSASFHWEAENSGRENCSSPRKRDNLNRCKWPVN